MSIIKDNVNYGVEVKIIREGGVDIQPLEVTENGTYTAEEGTAYSPVVVNVQGGGEVIDENRKVYYKCLYNPFFELQQRPFNEGQGICQRQERLSDNKCMLVCNEPIEEISREVGFGSKQFDYFVCPITTKRLADFSFDGTNFNKFAILQEDTMTIAMAFNRASQLQTFVCKCMTAPLCWDVSFGAEGDDTLMGRDHYTEGTNKLIVPIGSTGYDTGAWADVVCNPEKCGFTLVTMSMEEIDRLIESWYE